MKQISKITPTEINYNNKTVNGVIVEVSSYFDHDREIFFGQEMIKKNTLSVVRPMITLSFKKENEGSEFWEEGFTYELTGKAFGLFKAGGIHYIHILKVDHEKKIITTREHNDLAKVWDHTLQFDKLEEHRTKYTDKIILYTGWTTRAYAWYLVLFYKSRHRNWNRILNGMKIESK